MKRSYSIILSLSTLWIATSIVAQDEPVTIVGELADGTSPVPTARPALPEVEIRETLEHQLPDRKITIHRIKDPGLPDPRPKPTKAIGLSDEEIESFLNSPEVQRWIEEAAKTIRMSISVTVVDHRATLLRWRHDGAEYRAWSNANWMYLAGISELQKGEKRFSSVMGIGNTDSARLPEDSPYRIPEHLPAEPGTYRVIQGNSTNAKAFEGIDAYHELYRTNYNRLREAYELREQRRQEREAELRANPPNPEDIVLHFWKIQPKRSQPQQAEGGTQ